MRKTVQLALMGSLMMAAASPLATGDGRPADTAPAARVAANELSIVPLPAYEPEQSSGQLVRVWSI